MVHEYIGTRAQYSFPITYLAIRLHCKLAISLFNCLNKKASKREDSEDSEEIEESETSEDSDDTNGNGR